MPFGIHNAQAIFQWLNDVVLHDVLYCCRAYIDDIVVFSSSWENHCSLCRQLFSNDIYYVLRKLQDD